MIDALTLLKDEMTSEMDPNKKIKNVTNLDDMLIFECAMQENYKIIDDYFRFLISPPKDMSNKITASEKPYCLRYRPYKRLSSRNI
jgi:hypothetical protein